jgi:nucleoside-diphosphate-sugar epimerase
MLDEGNAMHSRPEWLRRRPVVLITGASGVVGQALLGRLDALDAVCLVHRTPIERAGVATVHGDVNAADLGLGPGAYATLARRVDAVVHCAAITEFRGRDDTLERTNVAGTEAMVAFAERAEVPLYHVSTAFLHARPTGEWGRVSTRYAASKRDAEEVVKASAGRHVLIRPSVVIGDSCSGAVSAFQGLYLVASAILDGLLPMIPFDPAWPMDFVPGDFVADVITALVRDGRDDGEVWVTAGAEALPMRDAVELCVSLGQRWGLDIDPPRFITPEMFDRLVAPVFLEALPRRMRLVVVRLLEFFAAYLSVESPLPNGSEVLAALGLGALPDARTTLRNSLVYWAQTTGRLAPRLVPPVAAPQVEAA